MKFDVVHHNLAAGRFELVIAGKVAVAEYLLRGDRIIFTHTWVPPSIRGKGAAAHLVRAAMAFAREKGLTVVPQCSYVACFLDEHAEFSDLRDKA